MSSHFSINQLLVVVVVVVGLGVVLVVVVVVVVVGTVVVVAFVVVVVGAAVVISTLCETKKRIETTIFQWWKWFIHLGGCCCGSRCCCRRNGCRRSIHGNGRFCGGDGTCGRWRPVLDATSHRSLWARHIFQDFLAEESSQYVDASARAVLTLGSRCDGIEQTCKLLWQRERSLTSMSSATTKQAFHFRYFFFFYVATPRSHQTIKNTRP